MRIHAHGSNRWIAAVLIILIPGTPASGFAGGSSLYGDETLDMKLVAFGKLVPGDSLQLETYQRGLVRGRLIGSRVDSLVIATYRREIGISLSEVNRLWVRGDARWKGAKIGAISGTALGILTFGLINWIGSELCDTGDCDNTPTEVASILLAGALLGAATGTLIGGGIGAATPYWHLRYESP